MLTLHAREHGFQKPQPVEVKVQAGAGTGNSDLWSVRACFGGGGAVLGGVTRHDQCHKADGQADMGLWRESGAFLRFSGAAGLLDLEAPAVRRHTALPLHLSALPPPASGTDPEHGAGGGGLPECLVSDGHRRQKQERWGR